MANFLISLFTVITFFSCVNKDAIISNQGVGLIKIGQPLVSEYNESSFDITLDNDNNVKTIIVGDSKYRTIDSFGVGTNFNDIIKKYHDLNITDFTVKKGKVPIIDLGRIVNFQNIIFVDKNKDNIVDYIIISEKED